MSDSFAYLSPCNNSWYARAYPRVKNENVYVHPNNKVSIAIVVRVYNNNNNNNNNDDDDDKLCYSDRLTGENSAQLHLQLLAAPC